MISTVLAFIAVIGPAQEPIDFQLGWKQGDKFTYTVVMKVKGGDQSIQGKMEITVAKAGGSGFTVSWPEITFARQSRPLAAGSVQLNRHGRVISGGTLPEASSHFGQMPLPERPVAVGDEFKVKYTRDRLKFDLTGKLDKIDEKIGRLAHFSFSGTMLTPAFGAMPIKLRTVFDITRGVFVSSELDIGDDGLQQIIKLVEKDSRE